MLPICTKNQEILVRNQMDHSCVVEFDLKGNSVHTGHKGHKICRNYKYPPFEPTLPEVARAQFGTHEANGLEIQQFIYSNRGD